MQTAAQPTESSSFTIESLSIPFGHCFGVPIRVHVLLPALACLAAGSSLLAGNGVLGAILALVVTGPLVFSTVLVHELGHVLAGKRCGCKPESILLWPLGGLALIDASSIGPKQQVFISGSGPATHLPMLLFWMFLLWAANSGTITLSTKGLYLESNFFALMCIAMLLNNLAMLIFNLLVPCFPLDCSQILLSLMLLRGHEPETAAKVMVLVSVPVLLALIVYGLWSYFSGMAMGALTVMLAAWMALNTWRLHQARVQGQLSAYPLFASVMQTQAAVHSENSASTGKTESVRHSGGSFKPFQGEGNQIGRASTTSRQVCVGSLLAMSIAVVVTCRTPVTL